MYYSYKLSKYNSIGTLNAEWTVYPFSSKVAAIPLVAVDIIKIDWANKVVKILLIINVLPVPPGADKNTKPGLLFFTLSIKDSNIYYYSSVH